MFQKLKKMSKELKEGMSIMSHKKKRISIKRQNIKKNWIEILELKSTIKEMENSLKSLNNIFEPANNQQKWRYVHWNCLVGGTEKKKKNEEKWKDLLRAVKPHQLYQNIHNRNRNLRRERESKQGTQRIFEEIMTKNMPTLMKNINLSIKWIQIWWIQIHT